MYRDLVFRPTADTRPGTSWRDGGIVADRPTGGGIDERPRVTELPDLSGLTRGAEDVERKARLFLDFFMGSPGGQDQLMAGYVPFKGVAPADIDPGGPESPAAMAALQEYLNRRRARGDFEKARQNLKARGIVLPPI